MYYVPSSLISSTAGPAIADGAKIPTPKLETPTTAVGMLMHIYAPAPIALAIMEGGNISSSSDISSVLGTFWDVEGPIADVKPEGVFMAPSVASATPVHQTATAGRRRCLPPARRPANGRRRCGRRSRRRDPRSRCDAAVLMGAQRHTMTQPQ